MCIRDRAGSSADESVAPDAEVVESSDAKPASSHDAPDSSVANASSVDKPVVTTDDDLVLVFYNITWSNDKMTGKKRQKHETALKQDLNYAFDVLDADAVFLSECGEIEYGLPGEEWMSLLHRICPKRCRTIKHQSHYTAIIDTDRLKINHGPKLKGPMTDLQGHGYRMCQYLEIKHRNSAAKPIQVFNVHCPASDKKPFPPTVRVDVASWLKQKSEVRPYRRRP